MIDFSSECLITLNQARRHIPGEPALSTVWRWAIKGVRGIRLETIIRGGRRYTSREAITRFICATSAGVDRLSPPVRSVARAAAISRAKEEIRDAGI